MTVGRFTFHFYVTCKRNSKPYVARIQWNAAEQKIHRTKFEPTITPLRSTEEIAECYFTVSVGDVVETNRGRHKQRDYRAFYLVAPTGYLILLALADEAHELVRIMEYLDGKITATELSRGRWLFETVTGEWRGAPEQGPPIQKQNPLDMLKDQATELQARLNKVNALIQDHQSPPPPTTQTKRTPR